MNQLCKVCGEPAAGYHFGAFTCEGCKSFFGRTYNNLAALGECKNNGQCVINKKNRTSCKSCRLKKCLMVGMSKSGSRYGRRSNWFKIHCLIQDQAEMNSRLAEQGVIGTNGQLTQVFNENKDLVSQYKTSSDTMTTLTNSNARTKDISRDTHSISSSNKNNNNNNNNNNNKDPSSNGASPNSSEGSNPRGLHSPYSSLFEAAKANGFTPRYDPSSSPGLNVHPHPHHHHHERKQTGGGGGLGNGGTGLLPGYPFVPPSGLPLSPVSPLSPLNPTTSFFLHSAASLFSKGLNGVPKLYNGELGYSPYSSTSRYLPLHSSLNPVFKTRDSSPLFINNNGLCGTTVTTHNNSSNSHHHHHHINRSSKALLREVVPSLLHDEDEEIPDDEEDEKPIDLTIKKSTTLLSSDDLLDDVEGDDVKSSKYNKSNGSKSNDESGPGESNPLDLTAKRVKVESQTERREEVEDVKKEVSEDEEDDHERDESQTEKESKSSGDEK